jgi:hypothetical protein
MLDVHRIQALTEETDPEAAMWDDVLVAGEDPYAFRGTVDVMPPHIRPDGEGGCVR